MRASSVPRTAHRLPLTASVRPRERILANLEALYRETYEKAPAREDSARMADPHTAYMRDQPMLDILLYIRYLSAGTPAAPKPGTSARETLDMFWWLAR
jgi:hypothetical protein